MANTFSVKIHGETREFENNLKNLNGSLKLLRSEARGLNKAFKLDPSNSENADKLLKNLNQQLEITKMAAEKTREKLNNIDPQIDLKAFVATSNQLQNLENASVSLTQKINGITDKQRTLDIEAPDGKKVMEPLESEARFSISRIGGMFKSGFSSLGGVAASAGKSAVNAFMSPFKAIGNMAKEIGIGALREIGSNITNSVGSSISTIKDEMMVTQTSANGLRKVMEFKGLADEYTKVSKALADIAIGTNINTADANKFASTLVGIGKSAQEVQDIVGATANANQAMGGSGEEYSRVALALSQINAAGKVTADNMNQINDANAALSASLKARVYENYKKSKGSAAFGSFNEAMKEGEFTIDDINRAMIEISKEGGAAIQTLPDSMDALQESVATKLQPAFDHITVAMADLVGKAADWVQQLNIDGFIEKVKAFNLEEFLNSTVAALGELYNKSLEFIAPISDLFETLTGKPLTFKNALELLVNYLSEKVSMILEYVDMFVASIQESMAGLTFDDVKNAIMSIYDAIMYVVDEGLKLLAEFISHINLKAVVEAIENIGKAIIGTIDVLKDSGILTFVGEIFGEIVNIVVWAIDLIVKTFTRLIKALKPFFDALAPLFDGITKLFRDLFKTVKDVVEPIIDYWLDLIEIMFKRLQPGLKEFFDFVGPKFGELGEALKGVGKIVKTMVNYAKKIILPIFDVFMQGLNKILGIINKIIKVVSKPTSAVLGMFSKLGDWFGDGNIDAKVKNVESKVNNSSTINNNNASIEVNAAQGTDINSLAREIARLIKLGVV